MEKDDEMPRVFLRGFSNQNPSPLQDPLNRRNDSKSLIFNFLSKNTSSVDVQREKKPHSQSQESPTSKTMLKSPSFTVDKPEKKTIEPDETKNSEPINKDKETAASKIEETPICNTKITPDQSLRERTPLLSGIERTDSIQDLGEDNCTSSVRIETIQKKAREIGTVREVHEGPMSESAIVDPKLEKKIEKIVEDKVKQKVEEIVEQLVDRKVETLMTEHNNHAPIQSIESIGESSERNMTLLLQKKALDKAEKMRYNEELSQSNISVQTSLKQSSIKGNTRTRFWEIDQKHGKNSAKNTIHSSVPKHRVSGTSNISEPPRSRKPSLPPLNQSRKGTSRGGDSSLILQADQNQSIETVPTKQDYSFLSYSNLQENDVKFVLNEFSEFSRVNKILEDNLRRQKKITKKHKKEKSIPISKLYDFYLPDNNRNIVHKEIKQFSTLPSNPPPRQSNSSPYLSEIRPRIKKPSIPRGYYMAPIVRGTSNKRRSQADTYDGNSSDENSGYVSMFVGGSEYNKSKESRNSLDQKSTATEAFNKFYNVQATDLKTSPSKAPRASNLLNKASQKRMNNSYIQPSTSLLGERRRSSSKLLLPKANQSIITEVSDTEIRSSHQRKGSRISSQGSQKKLTISRSSSRELIDSNQLLRAHYRIHTNLERRDSERSFGSGYKNSIVKANNKSVLLGRDGSDKVYLGEKKGESKWISTLEKQAFSFSRSKRPFIGKEIEYPGPNRYDLSTYKTMTSKKHLEMVKMSPNSMAKNKLMKIPSKTDIREGILNLDVTSQKFSKIQRRLNSGSEIGSPFTDQSQKNSTFSSLHGSPMKRPTKETNEMKAFTIEQVNQSLPVPVKSQQIPTVIITKTSPEQKPKDEQTGSTDLNKSKAGIDTQNPVTTKD